MKTIKDKINYLAKEASGLLFFTMSELSNYVTNFFLVTKKIDE